MTRPGDVRPSLLSKPPGDRYQTAAPLPIREHPDMGRALGWGLVAVVLVAVTCALLRAILDLTTGIIAVAAAGGWVIGASVRRGAWAGRAHRASSVPAIGAVSLGAFCWLAGLVGTWLVSMAILPGSSRSVLDRLTETPFLDWLAPQMGLADLLTLVLFMVSAAVGSRSASTQG